MHGSGKDYREKLKKAPSKDHGNGKRWRGALWILPSFLGVLVFYRLASADGASCSYMRPVVKQFVGSAS